jgi:DNA modification methylase
MPLITPQRHRIKLGDCRDVLPTLKDASVDAVITDPPYPYIKRPYGYWTESEWFELMDPVVAECRRVLKPIGSAVFILQPTSEKVGKMRPWLWKFMAKWTEQWNMVQDAWWWNFAKAPTVHCNRKYGLMRQSVKACVWLGASNCYRDQDKVLWESSMRNIAQRSAGRILNYSANGTSMRQARCATTSLERGGVTPINLLPITNSDPSGSSGAHGHGSGTPLKLLKWWIRYISPPEGVVLDPFGGAGTTVIAAEQEGRRSILIESVPEYVEITRKRLQSVLK